MNERVRDEIAVTLLEDIADAVRRVVQTVIPSLPVEVRVVDSPRPSVIITAAPGADPIYPYFHNAKIAYLRPSNHYRKVLGLEMEDEE